MNRPSPLVAALATGVLLAGVATAPTASAARSERIVNTVSDLTCVFETAEADLVFFGASGSSSSGEAGSFMFVESLDYEPVLDGWGGSAHFGEDGSFAAQVELFSVATGESVGTATVEAVRTVDGAPEVREVRERSGNSWSAKGTVTTTDYLVAVTSVTVPGYEVVGGEDDCTSQDLAFDVRTTNPEAAIYRDSGFDTEICQLEGLEFGQVLVTGSTSEPAFTVVIDDGVSPQVADGTIRLQGHSGEATTQLIDLTTEEVVADLTISVDLARSSTRQTETETVDGVTSRMARTSYVATIVVTTTDGRRGTAECSAMEYSETIIVRPGSGGH